MSENIDYDQMVAAREAGLEIQNPGYIARKRASEKRSQCVASLREATTREFKAVLCRIVGGENVPTEKLAAMLAVMGKSMADLPDALEDAEAEMLASAEAERVAAEKHALGKRVAKLESKINELTADADDADASASKLRAAIEREEAKVALPQRKRLISVRTKQADIVECIDATRAKMEALQQQLADLRPRGSYLGNPADRRADERRRAASAQSDRAMQPYLDAQRAMELPPDRIASAVAPPAPAGPQMVDLATGKQIRVGTLNGEEVHVGVGKLG